MKNRVVFALNINKNLGLVYNLDNDFLLDKLFSNSHLLLYLDEIERFVFKYDDFEEIEKLVLNHRQWIVHKIYEYHPVFKVDLIKHKEFLWIAIRSKVKINQKLKRTYKGSYWSKTANAWLIPYSRKNFKSVKETMNINTLIHCS
ncbi:hypothetical protein [Aureibacter tunicatorum]|uniref:Uncharacterized protein n=1 Tax=Aureibacter tunicatorum TaxID=866807 RepID=A0AAE3XS81_9BACT|nr:hypothetical protein [Aureibacter tunicatorum]MDR6240529.1 hypothetical protein [Aureibacter tunicatorum]BDD06610.1 hypothetical protein AUTU_40930 [Aureibacter tunicatorum]